MNIKQFSNFNGLACHIPDLEIIDINLHYRSSLICNCMKYNSSLNLIHLQRILGNSQIRNCFYEIECL